MDDKSNESSQFSTKDDIFSQYDDNFATEDCLKSYHNNFGFGSNDENLTGDSISNIEKKIESNVTTSTKIIPTFGKQKNKKDVKKQVNKPKRFVPPTKNIHNKIKSPTPECLSQHLQPSYNYLTQDSSTNVNIDNSLQLTQNFNSNYMGLDNISQNTPKIIKITNLDPINIQNIHYQENIGIGIDNLSKETINFNLPSDRTPQASCQGIFYDKNVNGQEMNQENSQNIPKGASKKIKANIGSIISSSLNILDDDDTIPLQTSQESNSDRSSIKNLSQSRNQSFCSVTSLDKTYKNLDCNSFKNDTHKVPEGNDFLNLFKNNICEKVKPVVMTTELGDIGFNLKYSDYIKDLGRIDNQTEEEKETCMKILNMYPKENSILRKKLLKK